MEYDDVDDAVDREDYGNYDDDQEDEAPAFKQKKEDASEQNELVNYKRGYTARERDMIEEWLRKQQSANR